MILTCSEIVRLLYFTPNDREVSYAVTAKCVLNSSSRILILHFILTTILPYVFWLFSFTDLCCSLFTSSPFFVSFASAQTLYMIISFLPQCLVFLLQLSHYVWVSQTLKPSNIISGRLMRLGSYRDDGHSSPTSRQRGFKAPQGYRGQHYHVLSVCTQYSSSIMLIRRLFVPHSKLSVADSTAQSFLRVDRDLICTL